MTTTQPSRTLALASVTPYLWIGAVLLYATSFAFPQTDDFCTFGRLFKISGGNPFAEAAYLYHHWTGRYSSSFLVAAVGWLTSVVPLPMQWVYAASLAALVSVYAWSCLALSRTASRDGSVNLPLAALMASATLVLMPSKLEGMLWVTGASVYSAGIACFFFLMRSIALDRFIDRDIERHTYSWRSLALIVAAVGFNEFLALAVGGYLALRIVLFARTQAYLKQNIAYFSIYLASMAISILAPGNFERDASIATARHGVQAAMTMSWHSFTIFLDMHILPHKALLAMLCSGAFAAGWLTGRARPSASVAPSRFLSVPMALIASFPMHLLVYSYLSGEETPGRIINQAYMMALAGTCLLLAWVGTRVTLRSLRMQGAAPAFGVVLSAGLWLLSSPQFTQVSMVTRDFGPIWRSEQIKRDQELVNSARLQLPARVESFSPEGSTPPLFQGADAGPDTANWINQCISQFYQVPSLEVIVPPHTTAR